MQNDEIFDSEYVGTAKDTAAEQKKSQLKSLLKETVNKEDMAKYGTSKPKRILVKAKITNG